MIVTRLDIHRLRRFDSIRVAPGRGLNVFLGDNGAGKTSILEALHLMAYGRSFRGRPADGLIRNGAADLEVFVEWTAGEHRHRAGLRHAGKDWSGRLDGENVSSLTELCAALAVVTFEPGSHQLIMGSADGRRRFLDWGLFHVEHRFMPVWRRYNRALRQRNALLKQGASIKQLDAWDAELASSGEDLTLHRQHYLSALEPQVLTVGSALAPSLELASLNYQAGWKIEQGGLADALLRQRERDRTQGFTGVGPHRADWRLEFHALAGREQLSRGQAKLSALSVLLGQAAQMAQHTAEWPIIALDDIASELDRNHQRLVMEWLRQSGVQLFVTGTELPQGIDEWSREERQMFHVEHGNLEKRD